MKRIIFFTITIVLIIACINLIKSIYDISSKKEILVQTQQKLETLQKENATLKHQLQVVQSKQFIEEQARDKLFLVKPGESTVFLPQSREAGQSGQDIPSSTEPNIVQWWHLLF